MLQLSQVGFAVFEEVCSGPGPPPCAGSARAISVGFF